MSELNKFYSPSEVDYGPIVPAYQEAFKGEPWYEVSKCADPEAPKRCVGGLSRVALGELCMTCNMRPSTPAYESDELTARFEELAASRPTQWYIEETENGIALASIVWSAPKETIAVEKYSDVPEMMSWIEEAVGSEEIAWLDEVFANKSIRLTGNLRNFGAMCLGLMERLDQSVMAFRTINPAMIRAAERDFGERAVVYEREKDVPDRRDFVVISRGEE